MKILGGIVIFVLGMGVGWWIATMTSAAPAISNASSIQELREKGYQFVSPLLVANPTTQSIAFRNDLEQSVSSTIDGINVSSISIYFQDLDSGQWVDINASDTYNPASLLKVPFMMAAFKEAEADPGFLAEEIPYEPEPADGTSTQFDTLIPGKDYSVDDLVKAMIVDSDNGAKYTLLQHIDPSILTTTFSDLDISTPDVTDYVISDRAYARFFKILYNATYLDPDMSEKAMELLSSSTFTQGLVAGVPQGVAVAHKFGQYTASTATTTNLWELSDCGVIYYPSDPYLLCVMTRGANLNSLTQVIQQVSKVTYAQVDAGNIH